MMSPNKPLPKRLLIVVVLILLLVAAVLMYVYYIKPQLDASKGQSKESLLQEVADGKDAGNYSKTKSKLVSALDQSNSSQERASILMQLSANASNKEDYKAAIDYYDQGAALDADQAKQNSGFIASVYEADGQTEKAVEYYKKALTYVKSLPAGSIGRDNYINQYEAKIKELGS